MTSAVLKWLANGVIGLVVVGTLWMAQAVQPGAKDLTSMVLSQAVAAADNPASAPTTAR